MRSARVVLLAGGPQSRWAGHLGVPKHLIPVPTAGGGTEPLLHRTVRQLRERGCMEIHAIVDREDPRYSMIGVVPHQRQIGTTGCAVWLRSGPIWSVKGRTLVLLGDWWHSDASMDLIAAAGQRREWRHLCRIGPSETTGQPYGEDAGVSFWPEHHQEFLAAIERVHALAEAGTITRGGSWEVWAAMCGLPDDQLVLPDMTRLGRRLDLPDDGSGDFDFPHDWHNWQAAWQAGLIRI